MRRVEWIGAKTPLSDPMINYRKMINAYTAEEESMLEAVTLLVLPLVRVYGTTSRVKGTADGYSQQYKWGPRNFVVEMTDSDAKRMFELDPDGAEFRDLDRDDHAGREPEVPWVYITKAMHRIMQEAANGPRLVKVGEETAANNKQIDTAMAKALERKEEIADRHAVQRTRR